MPDLGFLVQLLLRRMHYIILIAAPITVLGIWLAIKLPPIYSAQARLLVESPQVPNELAASTLRIETTEILRVLEQRMLSRGNMLALSRQFGLHVTERNMTADEIVADMRARIRVFLPNPRDPAAFVTITFDAADPQVSADVVGQLITQLTSDFASLRTQATRQTSDFFDAEVERLQRTLDDQRARLLAFQEANKDALPDSLEYRRTRQTALQERLVQIDREIDRLGERRDRMVMLFEQTGQLGPGLAALSPQQAELQRLRLELAEARAVFSSAHPRLQSLERRIDALEGELGGGEDAAGNTRATTMLDVELSDMEGQVGFLTRQKAVIEAELADLSLSIAATPGAAITFGALQRDLENAQAEYNRAVARRAEARIGERVEAQSQGRRLTVVEPPVAPTTPTKPNRRLIAAAGGVAGLALGVGLVGLIELLNPAVRRPVDITRAMGAVPFATLPMLRTRQQILLRRGVIVAVILLVIGGASGGLWAVDRYVMPLDAAMTQAASRTGLTAMWSTLRGTGL